MTRGLADIHSIRGNYEVIDHTADIGICVKAATLEKLFALAAGAMFDLMVDLSDVQHVKREEISLQADSLDELLVVWLNELLFRAEVEKMFFSRFEVDSVDDKFLKASVMGQIYRENVHSIDTHVKAATYHQLEISACDGGWCARVIFDV